jgi:hypothetical protein
MSYDLNAYRLPTGLSPKELTKLLEKDEAEGRTISLTAEDRERLAAALHAVDPTAERSDGDDSIEIFTDAIQVFAYESGAVINIPYHGLGDAGSTTMDRAFAYADVMTAHGLTVWDPQATAIVEGDDADKRTATNRFAATSDIASQLSEDELGDEPAPRWKFWKR